MKNLYISKGLYPRTYFSLSAAYIASIQLPSGAIPWFDDGLLDPWDHVEAAMGLNIAGLRQQARKAYAWLRANQERDGSFWPAYADCLPLDTSRKESHHAVYPATGVWHDYLIHKDLDFLDQMWPILEAGVEFALELQTRAGEIAWAREPDGSIYDDALITGCSSIYKSLECALRIAETLGKQRPRWQLARHRLGQAVRFKPDRFDRTWASKDRYSMDWFYPVLSGIYTGAAARSRLRSKWNLFVRPCLGCLCVSDQPWITVAESCELVMALVGAGEYSRAALVFSWLHHHRDRQGAYWTGYQTELGGYWPEERPTWTAGAVLLAADALARVTPAADLFTSVSLPEPEAFKRKRAL
ncbi:MAG: glycoside hydrolase family 116 protein [Desulfohalobiaceae bacterium]|nr:glycoside hydrolase family 116 protein [Desulfohalobiaceae bacterium]